MENKLQRYALKKLPAEKLRVLDLCHHIFKHAEGFYLNLAEIHREDGDIARIWGLLAVDKCNHSDTFKMASRLKGEGIKEITVSAEMATDILTRMKMIPRGGRHNPPSQLDALRFALSMEDRLNNVHFRHVVRFASSQDMELMASPLKSGDSIIQMMTEEYVNLTMFA